MCSGKLLVELVEKKGAMEVVLKQEAMLVMEVMEKWARDNMARAVEKVAYEVVREVEAVDYVQKVACEEEEVVYKEEVAYGYEVSKEIAAVYQKYPFSSLQQNEHCKLY